MTTDMNYIRDILRTILRIDNSKLPHSCPCKPRALWLAVQPSDSPGLDRAPLAYRAVLPSYTQLPAIEVCDSNTTVTYSNRHKSLSLIILGCIRSWAKLQDGAFHRLFTYGGRAP